MKQIKLTTKKEKRFAARYVSGEKTILTFAKKDGGHWLVGGDVSRGLGEITIYSLDDDKIYQLKGSHLILKDRMGESQLQWFNDNWEEIRTKGIIE